jgi:cysteinyl-tRNA synthetase
MSKSLKNTFGIREALDKFTVRQLRLAFLLQQWNNPMDLRDEMLVEVKSIETTINVF